MTRMKEVLQKKYDKTKTPVLTLCKGRHKVSSLHGGQKKEKPPSR